MANQYDATSPWRDEAKVALLRKMIAEGALRSEIARTLGVTRSAVIGKAKRLGLSLAGSAGEEARAAGAKRWSATCRARRCRKSDVSEVLVTSAEAGNTRFRRRTDTGETAGPDRAFTPGTVPRRQPVDEAQPGNTRVAVAKAPLMLSLLELEPHSCRWPFGDPDRPRFGFCGHARAAGSSYCKAHRDISIGAVEAPDTQAAAA